MTDLTYDEEPQDLIGQVIQIGSQVARSVTNRRSAVLALQDVTDIRDGKVYLDGSSVPVRYTNRLLVIDKLFQDLGYESYE